MSHSPAHASTTHQSTTTLKMAPKKDNSNKTFSFDEVAAMLAASNITIGAAHYKVMAKISGSRTESGFEHLFREVKARAKEIRTMMENGEMGDLGTKTPAKRSKSPTGASTGKKTGSGTKKGEFSLRRSSSKILLTDSRSQSSLGGGGRG